MNPHCWHYRRRYHNVIARVNTGLNDIDVILLPAPVVHTSPSTSASHRPHNALSQPDPNVGRIHLEC